MMEPELRGNYLLKSEPSSNANSVSDWGSGPSTSLLSLFSLTSSTFLSPSKVETKTTFSIELEPETKPDKNYLPKPGPEPILGIFTEAGARLERFRF